MVNLGYEYNKSGHRSISKKGGFETGPSSCIIKLSSCIIKLYLLLNQLLDDLARLLRLHRGKGHLHNAYPEGGGTRVFLLGQQPSTAAHTKQGIPPLLTLNKVFS